MTERFIPGSVQGTPEAPIVRRIGFTELTPSASKGYAESGDIFMPEPGRGEPQATLPKPAVNPELVRAGMEAHYAAKGMDISKVPYEELQATRNIFELEFNKLFPSDTHRGGLEEPTHDIYTRPEALASYAPNEALLQKAAEMHGPLASVANGIRQLNNELSVSSMNFDAFQERYLALQQQLNSALLSSNFQLKDGVLIATSSGLSEAEKQQQELMQTMLSGELSKLARSFTKKERGDIKTGTIAGTELKQNLEENEHIIAFKKDYEELDEKLAIAEGARGPEWQAEVDAIYDRIDRFIIGIDYGSRIDGVADIIASVSLHEKRRGQEHYGYALEHAVERIIGQGDVNPTGDYPQFGLQMSSNLDDLVQASRRYSEGFFSYIYNLRGKRMLSHALFQNLKDRKNLVEIVTRSLDPGGMRFIEDQIAGVPQILAFYEKELGRLTGSNSYLEKGWVMFNDYRDIADKYVEKEVNSGDLNLRKQVREWVQNEQGVWEGRAVEGSTRKMRTWETRRAFNMARANTGATLRRQIWGFYGDNPSNIPDLVKSLEGGEAVTMLMAPLARLDNRYFSQPGSQMYLDNWMDRKIEEAGRQGKRYAFSRGGKEYGLYGASVKSTVLLDTGVVDVKSSGWRNDLMFLRQTEYGQDGLSLDEMFNLKKMMFRKNLENTKYAGMPYERDARTKHALSHDVDHEFQHWLDHEGILDNQRLFLGVMTRRGDLTTGQKEVLWRNISKLLPSRIASLMPQFSMDEVMAEYGQDKDFAKAKWDEIQRKLFLAEHDRVQDDAQGLRWKKVVGADGHENWVKANPNYRTKDLMEYIDARNAASGGQWMDATEIAVVKRWQALGVEMSNQLATMVWPHTPFLDDVPRTAWENMGRNELDRLLINDHNDWQEAYGQTTHLIGNPAIPASKLPELFHKFVEHAKSPESLAEAQARAESFIYTWCKMARKYKKDRLTADIRTAGPWRVPTSMMQEFNLSSGISKNEEEIAGLLVSLANLEILADDPAEADPKTKQTQLIRLMHELKASRKDVTLWNIYDFFTLALFELARKALDAAVPDEVVKA